MNRRAFLVGGLGAAIWVARGAAATPPAPRGADGVFALKARAEGYEGLSPGPLLRLRLGETLAVQFENGLAEPTTLAFPGLRGPNAFAGVGDLTEPPIPPGGRREIRFAPPDAGFNVYGPDLRGPGAGQSARGLFGPIVVEEATPPPVELDLVALVADGAGEALAVNGAPAPFRIAAPPGGRVRLRLANVTAARILALGVAGVKSLVAAVDGQPSAAFAPLNSLVPIGPRARFELVFDMPGEAGGAARFVLRGLTPGEADRPLILVEAAGEPVAARAPFAGLPANPRLPAEIPLEWSQRVTIALSGGGGAPLTLNGASLPGWSAKPAFILPRGAPATLTISNATAQPQSLQLGGHVARWLHALDDGWEPYWRDTFLLAPGASVHAAFIADNPGKWPLQSTNPQSRDGGLATWFQVL